MFIWFIGTLRNLLSNAEGDGGRLANTAFGGGLIAAATLMVGFALLAVAELHPAENGAALTHALVDASMLVPAVGLPPPPSSSPATGSASCARLPARLDGLARSGGRGFQPAGDRRRDNRPRRLFRHR